MKTATLGLEQRAVGGFLRDAGFGDAAAAVSPVPPRDRGRGTALLPSTQRRCAGVRAVGARSVDRNTECGHRVRRRRLAAHKHGVHRGRLPAQPGHSARDGEVRRERDITVSQLAIAWTPAHPGVYVAIVGTRDASHVENSITTTQVSRSDADLDEIDKIMASATRVAGPRPENVC